MPALMRQLSGLAGCTSPVRLDGWRTEINEATGQVLHHLESADLPAGNLLLRCGNRRVTRCPSCAETYRRDTYHLITAGLVGGKGTPETVTAHPRVFATFTAPSFGPVHNRPGSGACRCGTAHPADDPLLGSPLAPETYDYEGAVLWNAHAGKIWARFTIHLRREIAKLAGLSQRAFKDVARISFGKVAEYQKRGAIHFHAVIRLDGPEGGDTPPPAWATADLLTDAIRAAAHRADIPGPLIDGRQHRFAFGRQLDIRTIRGADFTGTVQITERAVAAYIAKYATKGAEAATGTLDRSLCCTRCQGTGRLREASSLTVRCTACGGAGFAGSLARLKIPAHARRLIETCWNLGARPELAELRLRAWAHMLGFRGHFSTKTRRYSTTLGALRDARTAWRRAQALERLHGSGAPAAEESTLVLAHWVFAGLGLTRGEAWLTQALQPAPGTEGEPTYG
ncbi:replication initiation protein [Streptomyces rubellomurinus]|uniref:Replication initiation protein n=2 Tax=Streptomyces rubellomurinus (strain ATCC 31215) TaxID=359131 RepID=A0A0F2T9S0_STRR3|nr:replication initiation protein [Streptomyces rubellomurinus]